MNESLYKKILELILFLISSINFLGLSEMIRIS